MTQVSSLQAQAKRRTPATTGDDMTRTNGRPLAVRKNGARLANALERFVIVAGITVLSLPFVTTVGNTLKTKWETLSTSIP